MRLSLLIHLFFNPTNFDFNFKNILQVEIMLRNLLTTIALIGTLSSLGGCEQRPNANAEATGVVVVGDISLEDVAKVAEKVTNLAEHLTIVKTEIGQVIDNIQGKTSEAIEAMEQEISQIVTGSSSLEKTQPDFKQIFEVSQKLEQLVQSIVGHTITQAQTSRSLIQLKEEMVQVAERTADSSIAVSSAWQEVFALTRQLSVSVENFKIGDET